MPYIHNNHNNSIPSPDDPCSPREQPSSRSWTERLISLKTHQLTLLGHILFALGFLGMMVTFEFSMLHYSSIKQQEWLPLQEMSQAEMQKRVDNVNATAAEKDRMVGQLKEVFWRINVHSKVMALFYRLNFMSLGMISLSAGIATISLFFISKHGWESINNAVITIFILSSGVAILHSNLMLAMRYQDNIDTNRKLFEKYSGTMHTILSYWATEPDVSDSMAAAEFIYEVDRVLMESDDIPLRFDNEQATILREPIDYFKQNTTAEPTIDAIPSIP